MASVKSKTAKKSPRTSKKSKESSGMQENLLMKLFEDSLKDIYWAEKALTKALPKMAKNATSEDLVAAIEEHLEETKSQAARLEEIFSIIGKKATAKKCDGMDGLIREGEKMMEEAEEGAMCDAAIIAAAQKVEHYEISSYGTMRTFAEILGINDAAEILDEILEEEKAADVKLTEIATSVVNIEAAEEMEE